MDKPQGDTKLSNALLSNKNFGLPRKGNSAVRITAPKSSSRRSTDLPPSEELTRALLDDSPKASKSFPQATALGTIPPGSQPSKQDVALIQKQGGLGLSAKVPAPSSPTCTGECQSANLTNISRAPQDNSPFPQSHDTQVPSMARPSDTTVVVTTTAARQRSTIKSHSSADAGDQPLDIYATNYVPQYLRAINDSLAQIRYSMALPTINYAKYIGSFAGFSFLQPCDPFIGPPIDHGLSAVSVSPQGLNYHNYSGYLYNRVSNELRAQGVELQDYSLYSIPFDVADPAQGLYSFIIPGIRENSPRIDLGDTVLVRLWGFVPHEGLAKLARGWYSQGGPGAGVLAPGFTGWEYRAVVWGLQRSKEQVILRLDGVSHDAIRICNINFIVQNHKCSPLFSAIARVAGLLVQELLPVHWIRSMLFPVEDQGVLQTTLSKASFNLPWYDKQLNFEQQKAVDAVVQRQYGAIPFIISGPPGTGKTKTLVEAALQLLHSATIANERCHLLICAPSDSAADTIATRLKVHLDHMELFRLNGWTRSFAEVPEHLMLHSFTDNDLFAIPSFGTMMNFKVVVTTCRDAEMLVQTRLTNVDLAVLTTQLSVIASSASPQPLRLHWSALLLDEAAQATEPEALIPLTVIHRELSRLNTFILYHKSSLLEMNINLVQSYPWEQK